MDGAILVVHDQDFVMNAPFFVLHKDLSVVHVSDAPARRGKSNAQVFFATMRRQNQNVDDPSERLRHLSPKLRTFSSSVRKRRVSVGMSASPVHQEGAVPLSRSRKTQRKPLCADGHFSQVGDSRCLEPKSPRDVMLLTFIDQLRCHESRSQTAV
jgi:hypothetical protein